MRGPLISASLTLLLSGECRRCVLRLSNKGRLGLGSISAKISHPAFIALLKPADAAGGGSSSLSLTAGSGSSASAFTFETKQASSSGSGPGQAEETFPWDWNNGVIHLPMKVRAVVNLIGGRC